MARLPEHWQSRIFCSTKLLSMRTTVQRSKMTRNLLPTRFLLVFGTFLLSLLLYIDRVTISAAKTPIASSLSLSEVQMGWILSAFALGYALFQTPAGILADSYGPRKMLAIIVSFWSLFTAMTGAAWNYLSMLIVRFMFGIGEAGAFPGIARTVYAWIPVKERGLTTGINFSGSRLGAAFALPLIAWMINEIGWRTSFLVFGIIGFLWALVWYLWFRDDPTQHKGISEIEKEYILKNRQQPDPEQAQTGIRISSLAKSSNMRLAMLQYFSSNFTFFFTLTWLFPHIQETYQLGSVEAGFYSSAPLICGALGNWFSGWWVDYLYRRKNLSISRKLPASIGFGLAAIGLIASLYMDNVGGAIIFLSLAIFGADMTLSPSWSLCVDIGGRGSGAVSGTMNMAGNLGAFLTALAFPYLKEITGSDMTFFYIGALLNVLAIIFWLNINPNKQILYR